MHLSSSFRDHVLAWGVNLFPNLFSLNIKHSSKSLYCSLSPFFFRLFEKLSLFWFFNFAYDDTFVVKVTLNNSVYFYLSDFFSNLNVSDFRRIISIPFRNTTGKGENVNQSQKKILPYTVPALEERGCRSRGEKRSIILVYFPFWCKSVPVWVCPN